MEINDVQVKLIGNGDERLKASCTIVIDGEFVVRDVKIIDGTNGLFVAMPSRKLTDHCPKCSNKNHLRSRYCNNCGAKLDENRWTQRAANGQLHAEIAHPINSGCREHLHTRVISAYEAELEAQETDVPEDTHDDGAETEDVAPVAEADGNVKATAVSRDDSFGAGLG